jgi:hypothetical protein
MFTLTGTLKVKLPEQNVSEKFKKRDFVITDNSSQYPQHVTFQLTQDRSNLIEPFQEGQEIKVFFNLRGREWQSPQGETKYFNTVEAWKIEYANAAAPAPQAPQQYANTQQNSAPSVAATTFIPASTQDDDLPF